jgi:four helix bundle protein
MQKTANPKRNGKRNEVVREAVSEYAARPSEEKGYDLEERTYQFAKKVRLFVKTLPRTIGNIEDVKQLVRASGSVGANYIEANEALGQKDFLMKIKISRKEAKECRYFLRLLDAGEKDSVEQERKALLQEATELMNIFGAIFRKSQ